MSATIISGKEIAAAIRGEVAERVRTLDSERDLTPGLATVLVGEDPASQVYVDMKNRDAREVGFDSRQITLPAETPEEELLGTVEGLNADPDVHGVLVQLPLPDPIDESRILAAVDPAKDVDGFHPVNLGRLAAGELEGVVPCTPRGIIEMLVRSGVETEGKHAVVVGRSTIVGRPMSLLLLRKAPGGNATVTVAHSRTRDLGEVTRQAEILVVAVGRPGTVSATMVKEGAVVVDVGVNRVDDDEAEKGYRLVGDVAFDEVREVAGAITPVPGGVGPMTRAMLLRNTVDACLAQNP